MTFNYQRSTAIDLSQGLDDQTKCELRDRGRAQCETADLILEKLPNLPGIILGDEVGMGKTWIALIAAISVAENDGTVLVLTPSVVMNKQWEHQFRDLVHKKLTPNYDRKKYLEYLEIFSGKSNYGEIIKLARNRRGKTRIFVTSLGSVNQNLHGLLRKNERPPFDLLIIDEGHNFKNEDTKRYQIFHKQLSEKEKYPAVLFQQFRRALLLTATPFQLGHDELRGVLRIFEAAAFEHGMDVYRQSTAELITSLDSYQKILARFERRWVALNKDDIEDLSKSLRGELIPKTIAVSETHDVINQLLQIKEDINHRLLDVIIRNLKGNAHRQSREWGITLDRDKQLLFFLSERLDHAVRRSYSNVKGHIHALPSSYGRYEDHLQIAKGCNDPATKHYVNVCSKIFNCSYRNNAHPKLDLVADAVFEDWRNGEKSIVFCEFIGTIGEFRKALVNRVERYMRETKNAVQKVHVDHEKAVEHLRRSRNVESLLMTENAVQTSLIPLAERVIGNSAFVRDLSPHVLQDLARLLVVLRFDPNNVNYRKILGAFECLMFTNFERANKDDIPEFLQDDFAFYTNIDRVSKNLIRSNVAEAEEAPASASAVLLYLEKLHATGRLQEICFYPSIWGRFSRELEAFDVQQRLELTEIVSHYLTSDEFIYLSLLPNLTARDLQPEALVKQFWDIKAAGEPIGDRVLRFLIHASNLEPEKSLPSLIEDMGYRYRGSRKTNAPEAIVEVVMGGDDAKKLKTVTAFKAPFAPYILVSTDVLAEGVDLHTECRTIYHYDHEWNPAKLEQKNGRVDRVGSKSEREGAPVLLTFPFLKGTQDQKAREVVKSRASWFNTVMGKDFGSEPDERELEAEAIPLPDDLRELLIMRLDNAAHRRKKSV